MRVFSIFAFRDCNWEKRKINLAENREKRKIKIANSDENAPRVKGAYIKKTLTAYGVLPAFASHLDHFVSAEDVEQLFVHLEPHAVFYRVGVEVELA